ncbi:hypothetical protein ACFPFX_04725 [Streptomyces mauvecolor]|uniref:Transmembrane protein n=1 Tax=Streptomyces mauvecolor TaxID=58345 RepID=A0ABV9UHA9_9ACTN
MTHAPHRETAPLSPSQQATSEALIEAALKIPAIRTPPTFYKDDTSPHPTGAQPVPQPDSRRVPQWATGVAVAGAGIGVMSIGVGLGGKLFFENITIEGVIAVGLIVAAPLLLISAAGIALSKVGKAAPREVTNNFNGPVSIKSDHRTVVENRPFSFQRTTLEGADEQEHTC